MSLLKAEIIAPIAIILIILIFLFKHTFYTTYEKIKYRLRQVRTCPQSCTKALTYTAFTEILHIIFKDRL